MNQQKSRHIFTDIYFNLSLGIGTLGALFISPIIDISHNEIEFLLLIISCISFTIAFSRLLFLKYDPIKKIYKKIACLIYFTSMISVSTILLKIVYDNKSINLLFLTQFWDIKISSEQQYILMWHILLIILLIITSFFSGYFLNLIILKFKLPNHIKKSLKNLSNEEKDILKEFIIFKVVEKHSKTKDKIYDDLCIKQILEYWASSIDDYHCYNISNLAKIYLKDNPELLM